MRLSLNQNPSNQLEKMNKLTTEILMGTKETMSNELEMAFAEVL